MTCEIISRVAILRLRMGSTMSAFIKRFTKDESGATAIEYGLIAALIALVLVAALSVLGPKIAGTFNNVASNMP